MLVASNFALREIADAAFISIFLAGRSVEEEWEAAVPRSRQCWQDHVTPHAER